MYLQNGVLLQTVQQMSSECHSLILTFYCPSVMREKSNVVVQEPVVQGDWLWRLTCCGVWEGVFFPGVGGQGGNEYGNERKRAAARKTEWSIRRCTERQYVYLIYGCEREKADCTCGSEQKLCYRQRAEKAAGGEVVSMQWSPTMDVIVLVFSDHSVRQLCCVGLVVSTSSSIY